jgi:FMN phosphatase YigB (HAD superfamily)
VVVRAVFFDVGYTLFDETRLWREWAEWLEVDEQRLFSELREMVAQGRDHRELFERLGFDLPAQMKARTRAGWVERLLASDLYADARSCLANVKARGRLVGVAGNFPGDVIDRAVLDAQLPVDVVGSPDRWGAGKPSAPFFHRLIEAAGIPAEQIAYVGDRLDNDVLPARDAGIYGILLERGPWGDVHARKAEAMDLPVITSLEKLPYLLRGLRPLRGSNAEMTEADATEILRLMKSRGIDVWVDGGWGVDALLGRRSRPHDDIDLVLRQSDLGRLAELLGAAGFRRVEEAARPFNFVMADRRGREVDLHSVVFDAAGNGLYGPQPADRDGRVYPAASFTGNGRIGGEPVRCMTAEYQVANHTGYDPGDADFHDVYVLHEKFGIGLPDEFARREEDSRGLRSWQPDPQPDP